MLYRGRGPRFGFANQARLWAGAEFFYEALIQIFMLVVDVLTLAVMTIALFKKN